MLLIYKKDSGEIIGEITGSELSGELVPEPTIEVPDGTDYKNKKVNPSTNDLVWDVTLSGAKNSRVREIKERAYEVLAETDWYVTRKQETGGSIPQDVLDHRSQVRSDSDTFEKEVNDLTTVEDVLNYEYNFPKPPEP